MPALTSGYFSAGNYERYLDEFRNMSLKDLKAAVKERDDERNRGILYGANWYAANYSRALDKVARERGLGAV